MRIIVCLLFSSRVQGSQRLSCRYSTLKARHTCETEVKKSKFIAVAWPVTNASQALEYVESERDSQASHNCYAYKVGDEFRCTDDGEPGGTAGRPILGAIEGENLDRVCVMVTRYFGGTKLGAGGLVRAYAGAARECLRSAEKEISIPKKTVRIKAAFDSIGKVYSIAEQHHAEKIDEQYQESGDVFVTLKVNVSDIEAFKSAMMDATSGTIDFTTVK